MQSNLRVGVLGVGYWGSKHLRVLQSVPGVSEVHAIDERLGLMPEYAQFISAGRGHVSLTAALPHVDAVVIATPPTSHARLGLEAIAAGKHVLIEKPLATTTADAEALIAAADEADVTLMVGHTFEYNAAVWMLRDLIQSEELGSLFYLDSARLNLGLYQTDVNVIFDLAPHDISIANHVLGTRPDAVEAWGSRHVHSTYEDVAYLRLHYDQLGVSANIHVSWLDPHKVRRLTAVGSKKMAVYNDMAEEKVRVHDKAALPSASDGSGPARFVYHQGDVISPFVNFQEPLAVQDRHFADCIQKHTKPTTDGECGLAVVQVLECSQISLAEGRRVELAEVSARRSQLIGAVA